MVEAIVGVALRAILASVLLGGVLAGLVLLATRTLSLNAATRHALWTTALIATAVMPLAGIGMSLARAAAPAVVALPASHDMSASAVVAGTPKHRQPAPKHVKAATSAPNHASTTGATAPAAAAPAATTLADRLGFARSAPRVSRTLALGVVGIWIAGTLIGLIGLAGSIVRVRGLKRRSSPLDGTLADDLPWLTEVDRGREIYVRLSFETETPVAIGFRRPVILIPTELATADGLAAIEQLVLHEHAHLRRYDDWTNLIQRTIERIFWFNPIVWLVGRKIALEREIASDDAVVDKTGEPHAYATSLWKLAREMRMPEHAVVAPGALLTRKQIAIRIEQLLDKKRARLHRSPVAALGVALAGMLAVVFVATSAPAVELPATPQNVTSAPATAWHADDSAHIANAHPTPLPASGVHAVKPAAGTTQLSAFGKPPSEGTTGTTLATAPREQRVIRIFQSPAAPQSPKQLASAIEINRTSSSSAASSTAASGTAAASSAVPALPELTVLPPPAIAPAVPSLSPVALRRIRIAAQVATTQARRVHDTETIGTDIAKAIHEVTVSLPRELVHEVAQDGTVPARTRTDGVKLSRDLIASCTGCSFRNADARGLDLHGIKINANDFSGADMRGVNLSGAQLVGVSLAGANLANADLRNAQLHGVELRGANFDGAQLEGIKLIGVSVRHVTLRRTMLRSLLANCTGCDFTGLDLHGQDLRGISLSGADLSHADLHDANLSGARFSGVSLVHANLSGADLANARFDGCDLTGVDLRGARTTGMTMQGSGLNG